MRFEEMIIGGGAHGATSCSAKARLRVVQVEVADFDITGLIRLGHLDPRDRDDPIAIGDALYRLFDQTIGRR